MMSLSTGKTDSVPREGVFHQSRLVDNLPDSHCIAPIVGSSCLLVVEGK